MPAGMTRPFGHIGLVDDGGDSGGPTPPPTPGFLSTIYAAGLADDPSVDNLMTGPLQQFFVNLGATPPPFPPTNPAFFPESALFIGEAPADTGVGADAKPMLRQRRHFTTFPSVGDQTWYETRYDLFGGGINTISGGDRNQHVLVDQFENRLAFGFDSWQLTRPGLNAPGYTPTYLDNSVVSYHEIIMLDALGSGNSNDWQFNSDGSQFRRVFIPNVTGGGGGPAGPWSYVADSMSMWSRNGGEPLIGSRLYYDAITVQTFGAVDDAVGQMIVAEAAVLDAKNLGSGQAAGHGERWARSTLGGPLTLIAQLFDTGYIFPQGFGATGPVTYDDVVTFNAPAFGQGGATIVLGFISDPVDFVAPTVGAKLIPSIPGFFALSAQIRAVYTAGTGVCTTGPTATAGNNAGKDNLMATSAVTAANVNIAIGVGFPCQTTAPTNAVGSATKQLLDLTTAPTIAVTVPAAGTGGFTLTGYYVTTVELVPV